MSITPLFHEIEKELHSFYSGLSPYLRPFSGFYHRPWSLASIPGLRRLASEKCLVDKDGFHVNLDVKNFAPNEISVKTVGDEVVIEGSHEERRDEYGYVTRSFKRRFSIPSGYDVNSTVCTLSSDGVLTVKIPKPEAIGDKNVRHIQIQQVPGPAQVEASVESKETTGEVKENDK